MLRRRWGAQIVQTDTLIGTNLDHYVMQFDKVLVDLGMDHSVCNGVHIPEASQHSPPKNDCNVRKPTLDCTARHDRPTGSPHLSGHHLARFSAVSTFTDCVLIKDDGRVFYAVALHAAAGSW